MPKPVELQFHELRLGKTHPGGGYAVAYGPHAELVHVSDHHLQFLSGVKEGDSFMGAFRSAKRGFPFELIAIDRARVVEAE